MYPNRQQFVAAALVAAIALSVVAFAGAAAGVETTVEGPDEVTKPDDFTLTSSVSIESDEVVTIETYTLTLRPADGDESLEVTFAPNGTIVDTDPAEGVVGTGDIKVDQLREKADVEAVDRNGSSGYGYDYGGYGAEPTFTYDVELPSTAFDRGEFEAFLTVNTENETGAHQSNVQTFTVQTNGDENGQGNGAGEGNGNGNGAGEGNGADGDDAGDEADDESDGDEAGDEDENESDEDEAEDDADDEDEAEDDADDEDEAGDENENGERGGDNPGRGP